MRYKAKFRKKNLRKLAVSIMAVFMILIYLLSSLTENSQYVLAAAIADKATTDTYKNSLGDNDTTEWAGRVWTDRSVYTDNAVFADENLTVKNDSDLLVSYSILATTQEIKGGVTAPADVVFVIDVSGSMTGNMGSSTRIRNTITALNTSIHTLMTANENNRIGVVTFSEGSTEVLPLARWTTTNITNSNGKTTYNYFSVNETTVNVNATSTTNGVSRKVNSVSVTGGTNIQKGIYTGMNLLANATNTSMYISGNLVQRAPSLVLLSDGAPTFSVRTTSWWNPNTNNVQGPGSSAHYGNGMLAMMTAAYMKKVIDSKYGVANTLLATKIYTIGMGLDSLSGSELNLARVTLNPEDYYNANNTMANSIRNAFNTYNNNDTVRIEVNSYISSGSNSGDSLKSLTIGHPSGTIDITSINDYVDSYYDASSASSVNEVFSSIVDSITINSAKSPTEISKGNPFDTGVGDVVYTDPLGKYTEVKDVKAIIYAGQKFEVKEIVTDNNKTKYIFEGEVHNSVYGEHKLSEIEISVTKDDQGYETLEVRIPAGAIPLRVNTVELNSDNSVKSHTSNQAYPLRVLYTVGIQSEIIKNGVIDTGKVSEEYINANRNEDGTVNFYGSIYTGNTVNIDGVDKTVGDATVTFAPAIDNPFYYVQEPIEVYLDKELTRKAPSNVSIDDDKVYYYKDTYYDGTSYVERAIARTGAQLKQVTIEDRDGYWVRTPGTPRVNRMFHFEGTKDENNTNTATEYYVPVFENGNVVVHLGNNGLISAAVGGSLAITKNVTADDGLTAPDSDFEFTISLRDSNNNELAGTYTYNLVDDKGNTVSNNAGTVQNDGTITLKAGQTATIFDLPIGTKYEIVEKAVTGFTSKVGTTQTNRAFGEIVGAEKQQVTFINNYSTTSVTVPPTEAFPGKKILQGRQWADGDNFKFAITPQGSAPIPENSVVTVTDDEAQNDEAEFNFGSVTFDKPGEYTYLIVEQAVAATDRLPGMTYSLATYEVKIEIKDNGKGGLVVESNNMVQIQNDRGLEVNSQNVSEAIFTNIYSPLDIKWAPLGTKNYIDESGQKPIADGMFTFAMKAVGNNASVAPMPEDITPDANGEVFVTNTENVFHFDQATFTHEMIGEIFTYQIREVIPEGATTTDNGNTYNYKGMVYDGSVHTVTVEVTYEDPEIVIVPTYNQGNRIVFENIYHPEEVVLGEGTNASINGIKTFVGRDMNDGESFTFTLEARNQATTQAITSGAIILEKTTAVVEDGSDGIVESFDFGKTTFKKPGRYSFNIKEQAGNAKGVTYDGHTCVVTVEITDVEGTLVAEVTYNNGQGNSTAQAEFTNTYRPTFDDSTAVNLNGKKIMTGEKLTAGEYYFTVTPQNNAPMGVSLTNNPNMEGTQNNDGSYTGNITLLRNITYSAAGTYTYIIKENIPANKRGGITYDETVYEVSIVVEDDNNGNLKATEPVIKKQEGNQQVTAEEIVFNNSYNAEPATLTPAEMTKIIVGDRKDTLKANEFQFEMGIVSATPETGVTLPNPSVIGNAADGSIQFSNITFTEPGTYVLEVAEVIPTDESEKVPGIVYDDHTIQARIVVVDNGSGNLEAIVTRVTGSYEFRNIYSSNGELNGSQYLKVVKEFRGREDNKWLPTDEFKFTLVPTGNTVLAVEDGDVILPDNAAEMKISGTDAVKEKAFGNILFNKAGKYTFEISEVKGKIKGVTYDERTREITVNAEDNGDGTLTVTADITKGDNLTFENQYSAKSVELIGADNLKVTKELSGRDWLGGDVFKFAINVTDEDTNKAIADGDVVLPTNKTIEIAGTDTVKEKAFGNITFKKIGTYKFEVSEIKENLQGISYDEHKAVITIEVTDNDNGNLIAAVAFMEGELNFKNSYTPQPVTATLSGKKEMLGRELYDTDVFEFTITKAVGEADDTPMPVVTAVNNDSDGNIVFAPITYTKAGTYNYIIRETSGSAPGVTNDQHEVIATVNVTYDSSTGILTPNITYDGEGFLFTNVYKAVPTDAVAGFTAKKTVKASEGNSYVISGEEFEFTITPSANNPGNDPIRKKTVKNNQQGNISLVLSEVIYDTPGQYIYTVKEVSDNPLAGMSYDNSIYTITVDVLDDKKTGKLEAALVITKDGETVDEILFENSYNPEEISINLAGKKSLEGKNLENGEFKFKLTGIDEAAMPAENTVTNVADEFQFGKITYTKPGVHNYTITEINEDKQGYTYDDTVYNIQVSVSDDNGVLKADITGNDNVVFNNIYKPTSATLNIITGTKKLEGRKLGEGEFTFQLLDNEGNVVSEANSNEDGNFNFETLTFDKAGTYLYTIKEKNTGLGGIVYDTKSYTVQIQVDNKGGYLEAVATYLDADNKITDNIIFENVYQVQPTSIQIGAIKKLTGRDLVAKEFTFILQDENGNILSKATNDKTGAILFDKIEYDKEGTYKYVIFEEEGNKENIIYDNTVYEVTVTVKDSLKGCLEATIETEGTITFENICEESVIKPIKEPKINKGKVSPKTSNYLYVLIAMITMAFISLAVIVKIVLVDKRELKANRTIRR